jgi:hypothetical protein
VSKNRPLICRDLHRIDAGWPGLKSSVLADHAHIGASIARYIHKHHSERHIGEEGVAQNVGPQEYSDRSPTENFLK